MKYIILFITVFILTSSVYAAPFRCDMAGGAVFADISQCNAACAGETGQKECEELEPITGGQPCDTGRYRGFAAVDDKTFAMTNASVTWETDNTAKIRNADDNKVVAKLLKIFGVQNAWIGAQDRKRSTAYNNIDPSRFVWRDGSAPAYSNWRPGEPNNSFDASSIGAMSVYGEHWAAMNSDGYWNDFGLNQDGSELLLPAVVEFTGELACVSGTVKQTSGAGNAGNGMSCGATETGGMILFDKCSEGQIFGSTDSGWLCPQKKTLCLKNEKEIIKNEQFSADITFPRPSEYLVKYPKPENTPMETNFYFHCSGDNTGIYTSSLGIYSNPGYRGEIQNKNGTITLSITGYQSVFPAISDCSGSGLVNYTPYLKTYPLISGKEIANSTLAFKGAGESYAVKEGETAETPFHGYLGSNITDMRYSAVIQNKHIEISYSCPHSGRPCIKDGGGYSCSPDDCEELGDSGNFAGNPDETPEGTGDANNNGPTDDDGNCLGKLVIFPGNDKRCRMVGLQSKGFQCCKIIDPKDADKADVILFPSEWEFNVCNGSERSLAVQRAKDQCVSIGNYCAEKWKTGLCVQKKETFCCFDSDFSRAFNEAGMDMLNKSWGTPEKPSCGGFSPEELQELSAMNISDHPKMQQYAEKLGEEFSGKLMNEFDKTFKTPEFQEEIKNQIEGAGK